MVRPNKEISVFRVTGLKILGRVGTHIFFSGKNIILCILKDEMPQKKISRKPEKKILVSLLN